MKANIRGRHHLLLASVAGLSLFAADSAQARATRTLDLFEDCVRGSVCSVDFSDVVTGGGALQARLFLNRNFSGFLNIRVATSGLYNSSLVVECGSTEFVQTRRNVSGDQGDITIVCPDNTSPVVVTGAIDDI